MSEQIRKDIIKITEVGQLFDILLSSCDFFHTKEEIESVAKEKRILLNGVITTTSAPVTVADELILLTPQSAEPEVNVKYAIVYEDEFMLAVNKPANLPVHPAGKYYFNTLVSLLRSDGKRVYPINRLDRETSGIVLFATNPFHTRALQLAYEQEDCIKTYFAVVFGEMQNREGIIDEPLAQEQVGEIRDQMVVSSEGKPSQTQYKEIETRNNLSLLQITLLTGRRHQIRAHFSHVGHPLVGDKQYGTDPELFVKWHKDPKDAKDEIEDKLLSQRQLLHCAQVSFTHPQTGKKLLISANIGKDMLLFMNKQGFTSFPLI